MNQKWHKLILISYQLAGQIDSSQFWWCLCWVQVVLWGGDPGKWIMHEKSKTEKGEMPIKSVLMSWGQVSFNPAWNILRDSGSHFSTAPGKMEKQGIYALTPIWELSSSSLIYSTLLGYVHVQPSKYTCYQEKPRAESASGKQSTGKWTQDRVRVPGGMAASAPAGDTGPVNVYKLKPDVSYSKTPEGQQEWF